MKSTAIESNGHELTVREEKPQLLVPVDMSSGDLPDLSEAEEIPLDLMADYWTPTVMNETKRVFFDCVKPRQVLDNATGELMELQCAFFFERSASGEVKTISNGSKRLVGIFEAGNIQRGTPIVITYLGKKRNTSNSFMSDNWSVKPLILKQQ